MLSLTHIITYIQAGSSLGMHPANERHYCNVTTSLIGWVHTQTDPCSWKEWHWNIDEVVAKSAQHRMGSMPNFLWKIETGCPKPLLPSTNTADLPTKPTVFVWTYLRSAARKSKSVRLDCATPLHMYECTYG